MQVLRLTSFIAIAACMTVAQDTSQEKYLLPAGSSPLDEVAQILPIKRLVPGGSDPLDEVTQTLPVKRLLSGESSPLEGLTSELPLPIKRLSTGALPISALTSSLEGVSAIKRAVGALLAQEKRLSPDSIPGANSLTGILGSGLPLKRQVDLLNELGGLGGLTSALPLSKRLLEELTGAEGILSGGLPTKRQLDILNSLGGLSGLASQSEKRQLDILNSLAGGESSAESEFKRQLDALAGLGSTVSGLIGGAAPIKRSDQHQKRTEMALRALPGSDAITGLLSSGTESQKRLLDALSTLPGSDTITSLASGGLPTRRQLDLLNSLGGIGGLAEQPVKKQVAILQTLGGLSEATNMVTRQNLNDEAMKYVHTLLSERSSDGKGQRPVTRATASTSTGDCSVGEAQCCDQVINDKSKKETLAGLAGLDEIAGSIALNCNQLPIGILPIAAQNTCKSSPVCCNSVSQDGLVNFGCISLPIN